MDQAKRGAEALAAKRYADAITEYTAAIAISPTSPDYFIKRSTAHQRSSPPDYRAAFDDAEQAVLFAQQRARRELITQAQLRRAIALFGLERYADAQFVLGVVKRMDPSEKTLQIWENKIAGKLAAVDAEDPRSQVTVKETPEVGVVAQRKSEPGKPASTNASVPAPAQSQVPPPVQQTPAAKIRHDWYQSSESVYFTLLAKGVPKDRAVIDIQPDSLSITFPLVTDTTFDYSIDPLFAAVDVAASTYTIMATKVEVVLKKARPGQKWSALEGTEPLSSAPKTAPAQLSVPAEMLSSTPAAPSSSAAAAAAAAPAYPTSSRSGPKDWDKVANDLTAKKKKNKNSDGADGGDDGDDNDNDDDDIEGGDAVNSFFKKLYSGADPDVRRAMMKSFTESNGTALSTNWAEVSKGPVETRPPDGVEAKKWS
ncbi:hypothetical protein MBLNU459_g3148t1 [Dothideomycetes sp. NU459]